MIQRGLEYLKGRFLEDDSFHRMAFKGANSRYVPGAKNRDWAVADIPRR